MLRDGMVQLWDHGPGPGGDVHAASAFATVTCFHVVVSYGEGGRLSANASCFRREQISTRSSRLGSGARPKKSATEVPYDAHHYHSVYHIDEMLTGRGRSTETCTSPARPPKWGMRGLPRGSRGRVREGTIRAQHARISGVSFAFGGAWIG